ncbi:MAG TPA: hypothetical protein VL201_00740 [Patescibacteria group bacterium]|nr:hypothetical protein [Patescibacteria group bacterium]
MYIRQFFFHSIPFIGFLCGHIFIWQLQKPKILTCPSLIELPLLEASIKAAEHKIYLSVMKTIINDAVPQGTILIQYPKEKSLIKEQQIIYVSVSMHQPPLYTPALLGKQSDVIHEIPDITKFTISSHTLYSFYPASTIFAQDPLPNKSGLNNTLTIYISKEEHSLYVMPNYNGYTLEDVTETLDLNQIPYSYNPVPNKKNAIITDQRPAAGTIFVKTNLKMIYLHCIT